MAEGDDIYYSPASFVAHALNHLLNDNRYPLLDKRWFNAFDIHIEGAIPGKKEGTLIWALDPQSGIT